MANFTITVTNSVSTFGPAPSTKWGAGSPYTMTWGVSQWGEGTEDLPTEMTHSIDAQSLSFDSALFLDAEKFLDNTLGFSSETTSEGLKSGNGYSYVFTGPTTEGENRNLSTYSSPAAGSITYTSASVAQTSWS